MSKKLGILGGMGPLATADFFYKLTLASKANRDQDHIETIIYSATKTPDRSSSIMRGGESPLPAMIEGVRLLENAGASVIAIPCNTAHYWHGDLVARSHVPILHIAECACDALGGLREAVTTVGLLATSGTLHTKIYQSQIERRGFALGIPTMVEQNDFVEPAIALVKAGEIPEACALLDRAIQALVSRGADRIIMGCTEIPLALRDSVHAPILLDATSALATACVDFFAAERDEMHDNSAAEKEA